MCKQKHTNIMDEWMIFGFKELFFSDFTHAPTKRIPATILPWKKE